MLTNRSFQIINHFLFPFFCFLFFKFLFLLFFLFGGWGLWTWEFWSPRLSYDNREVVSSECCSAVLCLSFFCQRQGVDGALNPKSFEPSASPTTAERRYQQRSFANKYIIPNYKYVDKLFINISLFSYYC